MDFEELSRKGYFAANLPNIYSTKSFADWISSQLSSYKDLKTRSRHCRYNCSKRNGQRRVFSIPNPLSQFNSHAFFSKHKKEILNLATKSKQSLSKPEQSEVRCVKITPHGLVDQIRFKKFSEFKYVVYIDISRFYHSIYTHSLPWAAHGKAASKADGAPDSGAIFFNKIDQILRNGQEGQTLGIPVGPDTSRVLAEIINAAIDEAFSTEKPEAVFLRHVDDIWIGANSEAEAKELLYVYKSNLNEFELDLNESKTRIRSNHISITESWPHEIERLIAEYSEKSAAGGKRPAAFLNLIQYACDTAEARNDEAVVRLLLRKLDEEEIFFSDRDWEYIEGFLLQCALHFPHTIDYVARIVACRSIVGLKVEEGSWKRVFERIIAEHAQLKNDSEVTWVLWGCLKSKIKISNDLAEKVLKMRCDFTAILVFLMIDDDLIDGKVKKLDCIDLFDLDDMLGANWLLAHEVRIHKWLPAGKMKVAHDHSFLADLRKKQH